MAINQNNDEINAILLEILEGIVACVINGGYDDCREDDDDDHLITSVETLLSAVVSNTSISGDVQSTELQEPEVDSPTATEDAPPPDDAVQKDQEENVVIAEKSLCLASGTSTSGDAPSPKLELDDTTLTFVDGPLTDEAKEDCGKCVPPRANRLSKGWKRMKRIFRALCCCRCDTD